MSNLICPPGRSVCDPFQVKAFSLKEWLQELWDILFPKKHKVSARDLVLLHLTRRQRRSYPYGHS
jgi:hypothetical protein